MLMASKELKPPSWPVDKGSEGGKSEGKTELPMGRVVGGTEPNGSRPPAASSCVSYLPSEHPLHSDPSPSEQSGTPWPSYLACLPGAQGLWGPMVVLDQLSSWPGS